MAVLKKTNQQSKKKSQARATPRVKIQVAPPPRPQAPKRSGPKHVNRAPGAKSTPERALLCALTSPFDDDASGARVLGPFGFPTVTRRMKATFSVSADANGIVNAMVYPHPTVTVTTMSAVAQNAITAPVVGTVAWQSNSTGGTVAVLTGPTWGGFASSTTVANTVSSWRVVGGGLHIIPTGSFSTTSGIISVAPVPLHGELVIPPTTGTTITFDSNGTGFNLSDTAAAWQWPTFLTQNTASINMTGIDALPESKQYSFAKLLENGGIESVFRQTSPACQQFNAANAYALTNGAGVVVGQAGMTYAPGTNASENFFGHPQTQTSGRVDGWCGIAVYATGLTANQTVDFEVVLHLEGEPLVSSSYAGTPTLYESGFKPDPIPTSVVEKYMMAALRSPPVRLIGEALKTRAVAGVTALMAAL